MTKEEKRMKQMEHIEAQEHFADCRECQKIFQDKLEAQKKELLEKIKWIEGFCFKNWKSIYDQKKDCEFTCISGKDLAKKIKQLLK